MVVGSIMSLVFVLIIVAQFALRAGSVETGASFPVNNIPSDCPVRSPLLFCSDLYSRK